MSAGVQHHTWCEPESCIVFGEPGDGEASHYSKPLAPQIDRADIHGDNGELWRNTPVGDPEVKVRTLEHEGRGGVEVDMGDVGTRGRTSGSVGVSWLTPTEARELAALILQAAERAEKHQPGPLSR